MNQQVARKLKAKANEAAEIFSNPNRAGNENKETFRVDSIHAESDSIAVVVMLKNTGKRAVFLFYYLSEVKNGSWWYFVPTDSHFLGLRNIDRYRQVVEARNFRLNFEEGS